MVQRIESFSNRLQPDPLRETKAAVSADVDAEKVRPDTGVAPEIGTVHNRPTRGALNRGRARGDVQRETRVVLQKSTKLKSVAQMLPHAPGGRGRSIQRSINHQPVP